MLTIRNLVWTSRLLLGTLVVVVFLMTVKPGTWICAEGVDTTAARIWSVARMWRNW